MRLKDWTVLVVPHNEFQPHRFKISRFIALSLMLFVIGVGAGVSYLIVTSSSKNFDYLRYLNLQRENGILTQKLQDVEGKIEKMDAQVSGLMEENQRFRSIAGLDLLDEEIREVGIGGTFMGAREELLEIKPSLARRLYSQDEQVDVLLRKSALIQQSLEEAIASIEESREKWTHYPSIMPTRGYISSYFGKRSHPIYHVSQYHNGIDISCAKGEPIIAPADGKVIMVKQQIGYGLTVAIDHGYGLLTRFAHCSKAKVRNGQQVKRGDLIALVGQSGITTGPNLHYEVYLDGRARDPMNFILDNYVP
ncbi:MAG: peptidoglycan DD-metalloendopeptidase family protein [Candidatus Glassbacteria bacterium]|nr:peptidoglycan DD-metalloendopeptidase family protein [Candidatus Glassbacteria bacterium]